MGFGTFGTGAKLASVGGQHVYMSADGRAVTRVTQNGVVDTVTAGPDAPGVTAADLAAILVNIPK